MSLVNVDLMPSPLPLISWYAEQSDRLVVYEAIPAHNCRLMRFMFAPKPKPISWWKKLIGKMIPLPEDTRPHATLPCDFGLNVTAGKLYTIKAPPQYNVIAIGANENHRYPINFIEKS